MVAMEASVRSEAEALATRQCLLASLAQALCRRVVSPRLRQATRPPLLASAVLALVQHHHRLELLARSTRRHHLACRQPHRATTLRRRQVTRRLRLATRRLLHRSPLHHRRTVRLHRHTWAPLHPTTALPRRDSAQRRRSIVRQVRNSTQPTTVAPPRRPRHRPSVQQVRRTRLLAQLAPRSTRQLRRNTLPPLQARRHTLGTRGGRRPVRRTRLRHLNKTKVPLVYPKCTYGTRTVSKGSYLALYKSCLFASRMADFWCHSSSRNFVCHIPPKKIA